LLAFVLDQDTVGSNANQFYSVGLFAFAQQNRLPAGGTDESVGTGKAEHGHGLRLDDRAENFALHDAIDPELVEIVAGAAP
jgi:hypothetical protein